MHMILLIDWKLVIGGSVSRRSDKAQEWGSSQLLALIRTQLRYVSNIDFLITCIHGFPSELRL